MLRLCLVLSAAAAALSESATEVIILDDVDTTASGSGWHAGTFSPCLKDAYGKMFHHDWARNKGQVEAKYSIEAKRDGCYVIEEWHPGQDGDCAKYLPDATRVDIDYCRGKHAYTYVDQSVNGGQWNIIGALPFYKGWTGTITMTNNGTSSNCKEEGGCFWVTDAFRLVHVSELGNGVPCNVPHWYSSTASTEKSTTLVAQAHSGNLPQPVVIDDAHATWSSPWMIHGKDKAGSFSCGKQGWSQQFLFLDPEHAVTAESAATFTFEPAEDGCYLLEEFHPSNVCSQSMSSEVQLTVEYCKNKTATYVVDQSKYGNQWNIVAMLPFYKGLKGKVVVKHPQVGTGVAAADAFRFTRTAAKCYAVGKQLLQYHHLSAHPVSITIDDKDAIKSGAVVDTTMSWSSCAASALLGNAHIVAEGEASAEFSFQPQSTGCYRVDEFHPSASESCPLANAADVTVEYCLGQNWKGSVDLSQNGGQWNPVGHWPFYAGNTGKVISRRLQGRNHWAADGFRVTKVSESCREVPYSALMTLRIIGVDLENSPAVLDGELTTHTDLRLALHAAVVEAAGLAEKSVRLLGLRSGSIIAEFELSGKQADVSVATAKVEASLEGSLGEAFCAAAAAGAGCRVELLRSTGIPVPLETAEKEWTIECYLFYAGVALGGLALICIPMMLSAYWKYGRRGGKGKGDMESNDEVLPFPKEATKDEDKMSVASSGSTCTPKEMVNCEVQTEPSETHSVHSPLSDEAEKGCADSRVEADLKVIECV